MTGIMLAIGMLLTTATQVQQQNVAWAAVGGAFVPTTTIEVRSAGGVVTLAMPTKLGIVAARQRGSYAATLDWDLDGTDDAAAILTGTHPFWTATNWTIGR